MNPPESAWLPAPDLRPWIDFHIQRSTPASTGRLISQLPPSATASLTLVLRGRLSLPGAAPGQSRPLPKVFFSGARTQPASLISEGALSCLVVVFAPGRWHALLDASPISLLNEHLDVSGLGGGWPIRLAEQLAATPVQQQQAVLEQALRHWLHRSCAQTTSGYFSPRDTGWLRDTLLHKAPGQMARDYGLSLRQMERRFVQQFGLPPKAYQRLARHALLLAHLGRPDSARNLAGLASQLGYADQAHLSRDLRHFTGMPAGKMLQLAQQDPGLWAYRTLPLALADGAGMSRFFKP